MGFDTRLYRDFYVIDLAMWLWNWKTVFTNSIYVKGNSLANKNFCFFNGLACCHASR